MLVIMTNEQVLPSKQVCHNCLMANGRGLPRWHRGKLGCGHFLRQSEGNQPALYECEMGFHVARIDNQHR